MCIVFLCYAFEGFYTANALKLIEKCFLDLKNIFFNQENNKKFFSKQDDLSS